MTEQMIKTYGVLPMFVMAFFTVGIGVPFVTPNARFKRDAKKLAMDGWRVTLITRHTPRLGITVVYRRLKPEDNEPEDFEPSDTPRKGPNDFFTEI